MKKKSKILLSEFERKYVNFLTLLIHYKIKYEEVFGRFLVNMEKIQRKFLKTAKEILENVAGKFFFVTFLRRAFRTAFNIENQKRDSSIFKPNACLSPN